MASFPGPEGAGWRAAGDAGFRGAAADGSIDIVAKGWADTGRVAQANLVQAALDVDPVLDVVVGTSVTAEVAIDILRQRGLAVSTALVGDPLRPGQVLTNLGNNAVKSTESGEVVVATRVEALEMLDLHRYDGVLMDVQMPVMDGYTASTEIRRRESLHGLPVLAMTANAMAGDRERALQAGMDDHIANPINVRETFTTMARWITSSSPVAESSMRAGALPGCRGRVAPAGTARYRRGRRAGDRMG